MSALRVSPSVVVVDPHFEDYLPFAFETKRYQIHFIPTAKAALRLTGEFRRALWIISTNLPDFSGMELLEMLNDRLSDATVFLVTDRFQAREEIHSLCLGAAGYLTKPVKAEWLSCWRSPLAAAH